MIPPAKPREGAACNGCGVCCAASPCVLAFEFVPGAEEGRPCPALTWAQGRAWCGLVVEPFAHSPGLKAMVDLLELPPAAMPETSKAFADLISREVREALGDGTCDAGPGNGEPDELEGLTVSGAFALWESMGS